MRSPHDPVAVARDRVLRRASGFVAEAGFGDRFAFWSTLTWRERSPRPLIQLTAFDRPGRERRARAQHDVAEVFACPEEFRAADHERRLRFRFAALLFAELRPFRHVRKARLARHERAVAVAPAAFCQGVQVGGRFRGFFGELWDEFPERLHRRELQFRIEELVLGAGASLQARRARVRDRDVTRGPRGAVAPGEHLHLVRVAGRFCFGRGVREVGDPLPPAAACTTPVSEIGSISAPSLSGGETSSQPRLSGSTSSPPRSSVVKVTSAPGSPGPWLFLASARKW